MLSKRPRSGSGSQMSVASGSGRVATGRRGRSIVLFSKKKKASKPILWLDRTAALGLGFPQANTFPAGQVLKLHYNVIGDLTSTGSAGTFMPEKFYRLNSIYDPDASVGGAQPYYYDTLFGSNGTSAPYRQWRVIKTKVDLQWYNDNTSSGAAMMVGASVALDLNATAGNVAASQLMMQRPHTRIIPLPVMTGPGGINGMSFYVDHKQLLGVTNMKDADDQIGNYNSGPSGAEIILGLLTFPIDTAGNGAQVWYRLHITYTVECRTMNTVVES